MLAALTQQARLNRNMTIEELAVAVKVSPAVIRKLEKADPDVALGAAFEIAAAMRIRLFDADDDLMEMHLAQAKQALAILLRFAEPLPLNDDF